MLSVFLPALFGAVFQEVLRWAPLLARSPTATEKLRLSSTWYWCPALLVAAGGTIGTYYFTLNSATTPLHCMALGAAFPSLFKKLVDAVAGATDKPGVAKQLPSPTPDSGKALDITPELGPDITPKLGPDKPNVLRDFFR
jgi:hypothetical protein